MRKREELIEFVDSCLLYNIRPNRFSYIMFKLSKGYYLRDFVMSIHRRIKKG